MSRAKAGRLLIVGWREILSLPEMNIEGIKAKIDTGARTSSLHAFNCREFKSANKTMIHFQVHPWQRDSQTTITVEAELLEYRQVRSSGGQAQVRPVISTTIGLGEQHWSVELTLTNRDVMGFRMLLGRQAMRDRLLVNPAKSYLQSEKPYSMATQRKRRRLTKSNNSDSLAKS